MNVTVQFNGNVITSLNQQNKRISGKSKGREREKENERKSRRNLYRLSVCHCVSVCISIVIICFLCHFQIIIQGLRKHSQLV